jgi:hypothetical protein
MGVDGWRLLTTRDVVERAALSGMADHALKARRALNDDLLARAFGGADG